MRRRIMRSKYLEVEAVGDVSVVRFIHKKLLDPQDIQSTGEELFRLVDERGRHNLVLDFANLEYFSSTALGKFINLYKKVKAAGGRMVIRNLNEQIQELFKLSCLPWETKEEPAPLPVATA
jgi:anti-sigma B factor antagonist